MLRSAAGLLAGAAMLGACQGVGEIAQEGVLHTRFREAERAAAAAPTPGGETGRQAIAAFMQAGFALIRSECDAYFADPGRRRGAPVPISRSGEAAPSPAPDRHARRFLFGPETIDAVRDLVFRALDAHAAAALASPPDSYERALVDLLDHQAICTPRTILILVREAIAAAPPSSSRDDPEP
jgi:hypothetical protein